MENQNFKDACVKYFCLHCKQEIKNGQDVTGILSGSAKGIAMKNGVIDGEIKNIAGSIVFHDECFLQFAGNEYYPRVVGAGSLN